VWSVKCGVYCKLCPVERVALCVVFLVWLSFVVQGPEFEGSMPAVWALHLIRFAREAHFQGLFGWDAFERRTNTRNGRDTGFPHDAHFSVIAKQCKRTLQRQQHSIAKTFAATQTRRYLAAPQTAPASTAAE
jgi:hypothetical protein